MGKSILALLAAGLLALGTLSVPHPKTVEFKLAELCYDHPGENCKVIKDYCREALEMGHECYLIP